MTTRAIIQSSLERSSWICHLPGSAPIAGGRRGEVAPVVAVADEVALVVVAVALAVGQALLP